VIEKILFSSEGSPIKTPKPAAVPQESPILESTQASTENIPKQTPTSRPILKRKAEAQPHLVIKPSGEPSAKRAKSEVAPSPKLEKFLKRGVVRGKTAKVGYFQEQGLEVFLEKLKAQGWFELFMNTKQHDVAEFYANV